MSGLRDISHQILSELSSGPAYFERLRAASGKPSRDVSIAIGKLRTDGLLDLFGTGYELTEKGRARLAALGQGRAA